jgi:hypothetical protein
MPYRYQLPIRTLPPVVPLFSNDVRVLCFGHDWSAVYDRVFVLHHSILGVWVSVYPSYDFLIRFY